MLAGIRTRLSYANVVSTLCLGALLGGTAYAVERLDGAEIAKRSIPADRLERNKVGPKEVAGLRAGDFEPGQLPTGPTGPEGPRGPAGNEGPQGPAGTEGAPGTARAFAFVGPNGTNPPDLIRGKGFSGVTRAGFNGGYCLTPSATVHPDADPALVSVAGGGSGGNRLRLVEWRDSGPDCAASQYEVITSQGPLVGGETQLSNSVAFVLVVP